MSSSSWRWPNFTRAELACRCGCEGFVEVPEFLDRLQALRTAYARPLAVTSGYRCPEHNARVSGTGRTGPHTTGRAVDLAVRGAEAYKLLLLAFEHGFTGLGINQKGASRFLHLDDLPEGEPAAPRPTVWSY